MSDWFIRHRQGFIADMLGVYGQVNRASIIERFGVTQTQAASDIGMFVRENPDAMFYDGRAKAYVVDKDKLPRLKPTCETAEALRIRQLEHVLEQIEAVANASPITFAVIDKIVGLARRGRDG